MQNVLDYLFGTASFIPHGYCLTWRPDLVALHGISDGLIAAAYFSIPIALLVFLNRRRDLAFRGTFGHFALFIFACGMTHLAALVTLWEPYYGLQGLIKLATALVSITTAITLWPLIPRAVALPSPAQLATVNRRLEGEIAERRTVQAELRKTNDELELRVAERTEALEEANRRLQRELAEREILEAELRRSRERLEWAVSGTNDGLWDWDLTTDELYYSPVYLRLLGFGPDELPSDLAAWRERIHPDDLDRVEQATAAHFEGRTEVYQCPHRLRRKDGAYIWVGAKGRAVRDAGGKVVHFTGRITDVTEQKRAEEALRDSEAQLRAVFDTAVDGLVVIDEQGSIQNYNRACETLFGHTAQQAIGQNVTLLMPGLYRDEHEGYIERHRTTGERRIVGVWQELVGLRKDGTTFPIELSVGEARQQGRPIFIGIIRDITERKAAKQALEQKADELIRKNAELEDFAYIASHDLQEPLRMVTGYCQLLQRRYAGKLDSDADEFLQFVMGGVSRMQALIRDLLRLARLSAHEPVREPVDCNAVLEGVRLDLKAAIEESRADITSDPLPVIEGDATQIGQLFLNLLGNAIKFRGEQPPRIHVAVEEAPREWRFAVQDNGIGIEPRYHDRVFTIFRRLHGSEAYPGTGVGLSICKKIVEHHGGRIWLDPEVEAGTRFCFTIRKAG